MTDLNDLVYLSGEDLKQLEVRWDSRSFLSRRKLSQPMGGGQQSLLCSNSYSTTIIKHNFCVHLIFCFQSSSANFKN